jgi:hypothetical protein
MRTRGIAGAAGKSVHTAAYQVGLSRPPGMIHPCPVFPPDISLVGEILRRVAAIAAIAIRPKFSSCAAKARIGEQ